MEQEAEGLGNQFLFKNPEELEPKNISISYRAHEKAEYHSQVYMTCTEFFITIGAFWPRIWQINKEMITKQKIMGSGYVDTVTKCDT